VECTAWCVEGDGHKDYVFRQDQWCGGEQLKVVLGLEAGAPALPMTTIPCDAPAISVYARRRWHALPDVVVNVYLEARGGLGVDTDVHLTAEEARQLAEYLVATADLIDGAA